MQILLGFQRNIIYIMNMRKILLMCTCFQPYKYIFILMIAIKFVIQSLYKHYINNLKYIRSKNLNLL